MEREKPETKSWHDARLSRRNFLRAAGVVGLAATLEVTDEEEAAAVDTEPGPPVVPHITMERKEVLTQVDLLKEGTFQVAGNKLTDSGLEVTPTGLAIRNKRANNRYDPNPQLNVYGSRLQVSGDFSVATTLQSDQPMQMDLYGTPPIRYDDFNYYKSRLSIVTGANSVAVSVYDGSTQTPTPQNFEFSGSASDLALEVQRDGANLLLNANGATIATLSGEGKLFDTNQVWFGFNINQGSGLVSELTAKPLSGDTMDVVNTQTIEITEPSPPGLQNFVTKPNFLVGSATSLNELMFDPQDAQIVLGGNFGRGTFETELKPEIQSKEGLFNFERADALLDIAAKFGLKVRGHTLVYPAASPEWMLNLPVGTAAERLRVQQVMETHVSTVAAHLNGKVDIIDVVNEAVAGYVPILDPPRVDQNIFYQAYGGEQYIDRAFQVAHEAAPNAKLYLNDYAGNAYDLLGHGQALVALAQRLVSRGVPIHGIGLECHVNDKIPIPSSIPLPPGVDPEDSAPYLYLRYLMNEFDKIKNAQGKGLEVQITELSVSGRSGSATDIDKQAQQYSDAMRAGRDAPNCTGVTTWQTVDTYGAGSFVNDQGQLIASNETIYTAQYQPKEAKRSLDAVLQGS